MLPLVCDVIGCGRPASWVQVARLESAREDFLCNPCWARLRAKSAQQAQCYTPCEDEDEESVDFLPALMTEEEDASSARSPHAKPRLR